MTSVRLSLPYDTDFLYTLCTSGGANVRIAIPPKPNGLTARFRGSPPFRAESSHDGRTFSNRHGTPP